MDSLDAQCLVVDLLGGKPEPPDFWRHDRSGALSFAYEGSDRSFTWGPDAVADMARKWRESDVREIPEAARLFIDMHERLEAMAEEAGLGPPDVTIHHLIRAGGRATWGDEKLVLVVDENGEKGDVSPGIPSPRAEGEHPGPS